MSCHTIFQISFCNKDCKAVDVGGGYVTIWGGDTSSSSSNTSLPLRFSSFSLHFPLSSFSSSYSSSYYFSSSFFPCPSPRIEYHQFNILFHSLWGSIGMERGVRALSYSFKYTLSCIASIALIISAMLLPISHVEILF